MARVLCATMLKFRVVLFGKDLFSDAIDFRKERFNVLQIEHVPAFLSSEDMPVIANCFDNGSCHERRGVLVRQQILQEPSDIPVFIIWSFSSFGLLQINGGQIFNQTPQSCATPGSCCCI